MTILFNSYFSFGGDKIVFFKFMIGSLIIQFILDEINSTNLISHYYQALWKFNLLRIIIIIFFFQKIIVILLLKLIDYVKSDLTWGQLP